VEEVLLGASLASLLAALALALAAASLAATPRRAILVNFIFNGKYIIYFLN
jgi:hypothetical protein